MPESEPKPKLIELVGSGAGQGWKAVLKSGKPAVVHEIPIPQAEAAAAVPRLQRLFEHRHPALAPVLAWGTDQQGVWVAVEPNEGTSLGSILSRGPLTPPAAAALGTAVLSGVAALHEAGIAMGGFGATAIRVTSNGEVRLAGHPAAAVRGAPSQSDLRADVRSSGMAVCAAFGVDPAGAPAPPNIPPGLVVTVRSMASGAMGPSADRAQGALREMSAALLAPDRQVASQSELATRAGGREVPAITPFLPAGTVPPPGQTVAPAPYIASPRKEDTPVRSPASYDAPDRPLQTYPAMPAVIFPPALAEPAAPAPPAEPVAPAASAPAIPTWSDPSAPVEPAKPAEPEPPQPAEPEAPKPAKSWELYTPSVIPPSVTPPAPASPFSTNPPAPASPFSTNPPAPASAFSTNPPAPAEPAAAPPAPTPAPPAPAAPYKPPAQETWSPVEAPVWKPGATIPAEPLGTGTPVADAPRATNPPAPAPAPFRTPTTPPAVRRPMAVPRPRSGGGGLLEDRPPWLVPVAVAVAIVLLLGIFGIIVLANRGNGTTGQVHTTPSPHASGTARSTPSATATTKAPLAVPSFGPASADGLTKVQFCTTATPCPIQVGTPAETGTACDLNSCTIEVALYFTSGQKVPVKYDLKFFDRCTGTTTDLPGPPAFTPPGYAVVIPRDKWPVSIPSGVKSGALVAVASQPAIAASAPLLLGGESC
jgi:serine/threonine protein kinase